MFEPGFLSNSVNIRAPHLPKPPAIRCTERIDAGLKGRNARYFSWIGLKLTTQKSRLFVQLVERVGHKKVQS